MMNGTDAVVILAARLFLAALFLIFGWRKLRDYPGTVSQMVGDGVPVPVLATVVAIFMELPVSFAIAVGVFTRLLAVLMALYTLGTSLIEHRYWTMSGESRVAALENFYKNLSIMGGFLLLQCRRTRKIFHRCAVQYRLAMKVAELLGSNLRADMLKKIVILSFLAATLLPPGGVLAATDGIGLPDRGEGRLRR